MDNTRNQDEIGDNELLVVSLEPATNDQPQTDHRRHRGMPWIEAFPDYIA